MKASVRQTARRGAIVSGANPIPVPGDRGGAGSEGLAPRAGTFARARPINWFGRRRAIRRSMKSICECVAIMRGRRPIPKIETKKPAAELRPARVNQTRLDDVILPVFCPTSQTLFSESGTNSRRVCRLRETKNPPRIVPHGLNQTRFDYATLPVFCPTSQTSTSSTTQKLPAHPHSCRSSGRIQRENHSSASFCGLPGSFAPQIGGGMT